ncbi:MAG: tRNA epoxyqueuosine(34) reductase QueG, partial [Planctomycetota bacterium]
SVIVCALSYNVPLERGTSPTSGKIAKYALGEDYHKHLKKRLHALADWLREREPAAKTRAATDTAPILEREWAARAGVGWQAKNTLAIDTTLGSFLLLGEIVTTLALPVDDPAIDRCGSCTACIDACPTDAITPYSVDATRCISYWTIEHRGEVPGELAGKFDGWLFGCDVCQDVCPWNRKATIATDLAVQPKPQLASGTLDAAAVLDWQPENYQQTLRGTAMKRVKLPQLKRNATIVLHNAGHTTVDR